MTKLIIPDNPEDVHRCTPLSWMRLRVEDSPVTGMLVGSKANRTLLYVGKDGNLRQISVRHGDVAFVDYLTTTDSVTIFGSADAVHEVDNTPLLYWSTRPKPERVSDIPDYVPFLSYYQTCPKTPWPSMWIRFDDKRCRLIAFDETMRYGTNVQGFGGECFDGYAHEGVTDLGRNRSAADTMYKFVEWVDPEVWMPRFVKHKLYAGP